MDCCLFRRRTQQILKEEPELLERWDEIYGDRMTELVLIGIGMDQKQIQRDSLDRCLLTDDEMLQIWMLHFTIHCQFNILKTKGNTRRRKRSGE